MTFNPSKMKKRIPRLTSGQEEACVQSMDPSPYRIQRGELDVLDPFEKYIPRGSARDHYKFSTDVNSPQLK